MDKQRRGRPRILALVVFSGALIFIPTNYADEVDELAISKDYTSLPRTIVVVPPVPQPAKPKGKLKIAESLGEIMTEELLGALRRQMPSAEIITTDAAPDSTEGLMLKVHFSKLVPGSRAKRFWLGFGAGKSITEISGEVRERASGRVVARFTHARLSWCCGFGDNTHEISTNLANAATDIAAIVAGKLEDSQSYTWLEPETELREKNDSRDLEPPTGTVVIDASSGHAEVLLDGKYVGNTPLEVRISIGPHQVLIRRQGFDEWIREIHVMAGAKQSVWADLEKQEIGKPTEIADEDQDAEGR